MRIIIDSGHGGRDSGAVGPGGTKEKDVTLAVSKLLAQYLAPIAEVKLLRTEDRAFGEGEAADLRARVAIAEQYHADIYLSIHCNAVDAPSAQGMEAYTTPGQGKSDPIAEAIVQAWNKEFPGMAIRKDLRDGDSDKEANFYVLRRTSMPAVLVEMAFISNPAEEKLLKDPAWQDRAARAIARGVAAHLGKTLPEQQMPTDTWRVFVGNKILNGFNKNGRIYVQVREVAEALGHSVIYNAQTKTVKVI